MTEPVRLLGVAHGDLEQLARTVEILSGYPVEGKRALLELPRELAHLRFKEWRGGEFFFILDKYLKARGAQTIWGESYRIHKKADEESEAILEEYRTSRSWRQRLFGHSEADEEKVRRLLHEAYTRERDPHFLAQVNEHNPDLVVLGDAHVRFLIAEYYKKSQIPYLYENNLR